MCTVEDLSRKDVINLKDGARLGFVCDVDVDIMDGRVVALIIFGRARFFGLFGRDDDLVIPWPNVQKIGEDIIFVECEPAVRPRPRKGKFFSFI